MSGGWVALDAGPRAPNWFLDQATSVGQVPIMERIGGVFEEGLNGEKRLEGGRQSRSREHYKRRFEQVEEERKWKEKKGEFHGCYGEARNLVERNVELREVNLREGRF